MAAATVLVPLSAIQQSGGVLPPSALAQHSPRHGRSRGASFKNGKGGQRYNVIEDTDVTIRKVVEFVLKRTVEAEKVTKDEERPKGLVLIVSDAEGWVSVADVLAHPKLAELGASLADIQRVTPKARFTLRQLPDSSAQDTASWRIQLIQRGKSVTQAPPLEGEVITADTPDLPAFVVYETTYEAYPLIVNSGAIKVAPGAPHVYFTAVDSLSADREADVAIWVDLAAVMKASPETTWRRTTGGDGVFTTADVPRSLWSKAVARRAEVGVLFEDGQVLRDVPEYLRGKGHKGRAKKERLAGLARTRGEDDSESASDEVDE